jgi:hypothetical protein
VDASGRGDQAFKSSGILGEKNRKKEIHETVSNIKLLKNIVLFRMILGYM